MLARRFRIFKKGWNDSTKGRVLFDEQAAKDVMSDYATRGVKMMVDLEHLSLDDTAPNYDPDSRGWCKFQVVNGELWAEEVTWNKDGTRRLVDGCQRYMSPAFRVDKETRRVKAVLNLALVAMPATHGAQDLAAASLLTKLSDRLKDSTLETLTIEVGMPPEILQLLGLTPEATADEVLTALKALVTKAAATAAPAPGNDGMTPEMQARFMALTVRAEAGDSAVKKLKAIEDKEKETEKTVLLSKLPKNLEEWGSKQTVESLKEFLKYSAPAASEIEEEASREEGSGGTEVKKFTALTSSEVEACKATGTKPEAFLAFKNKQAQAQ